AACGTWFAAALFSSDTLPSAADAWRYIALSLTGCAAVAVLGARRPGVAAWNFVVLALLAVNLLPLVDGVLRGQGVQIDAFHKTCVAVAIAVGVLNYLPTRLGPAMALLAFGLALGLTGFMLPSESKQQVSIDFWAVACAPWLGYATLRTPTGRLSEFDKTWRTFRDRFGMVWGLRLREQFNRAAAHAGWQLVLTWRGLRALGKLEQQPQPEKDGDALTTLQALMKRFGTEEDRLTASLTSR